VRIDYRDHPPLVVAFGQNVSEKNATEIQGSIVNHERLRRLVPGAFHLILNGSGGFQKQITIGKEGAMESKNTGPVPLRSVEEALQLKPIQWRMPTEEELKDEFHEGDIDSLLLPSGYPRPGEREDAFEFFKKNLREMEIDHKDLEDENAWRFRFKDYATFKKQVTSYGGPKDPDSMVRKIQAGGALPMPVVIRKTDGSLRLAGGATRTSIAALADQKIRVLVIDQSAALKRRIDIMLGKIAKYISESKNPKIKELNQKIMQASAHLSPEELKHHWNYEEDGEDFGFDGHHLSIMWERIRSWEHKMRGEK